MEIVLILVPVTLVLVALGVLLFSWAVKNGQYDDLDGPAHRILYDDDKDMIPKDARQDLTEAEKQGLTNPQEQKPQERVSQEKDSEDIKPEPGQESPPSDRKPGPDAPR